MVRTGVPGAAALIPDAFGDANCADLVIIRPSREVDAQFLCYSINATASTFVSAHTVGAVQQHFNVGSAKQLTVALPPLVHQKAITSVLAALDDKIAVNKRIIATADALRGQLFKSALAEKPTLTPLTTFAEFVNGRAFTKDATGTGRMVVRIAEINSGPSGSTVYNDLDVPDVHLARPGDILFSWSGSLAVCRWFRAEAIINQHIFKVIPRDGVAHWLLFELIDSALTKFRGIAADKATTMGHIQRRHLDEPVMVPNAQRRQVIDGEARALWDRALAAETESLQLTELRDALLPKLMSGEIRVRDAERLVGDAL